MLNSLFNFQHSKKNVRFMNFKLHVIQFNGMEGKSFLAFCLPFVSLGLVREHMTNSCYVDISQVMHVNIYSVDIIKTN